MSDTGGLCLICGDTVNIDPMDHMAQSHSVRSEKPRADKLSWSDRVTRVQAALEEIKAGDNVGDQIFQLDEQVIKPLYLVRARLTEMRRQRATEGSNHGSS